MRRPILSNRCTRLPHHVPSLLLRRRRPFPTHLRFQTTNSPQPPRSTLFHRLRPHFKPTLYTLLTYLSWLPALLFIHTHIFQIMTVTGPSMYPFLNTSFHTSTQRDRILVSLWNPHHHLHRGTLIAFRSPQDPEKLVVKRITALPGDVVETKEPYPMGVEEVPVGHVWVEGEHPQSREKSYDSNFYGPVSMSLVVGRAVGVVWPWERRGWVRWQDWRGDGRVREGARKVERVEFYGAR